MNVSAFLLNMNHHHAFDILLMCPRLHKMARRSGFIDRRKSSWIQPLLISFWILLFMASGIKPIFCAKSSQKSLSQYLQLTNKDIKGIKFKKSKGQVYQLELTKSGHKTILAKAEKVRYNPETIHHLSFEYKAKKDATVNLYFGDPFQPEKRLFKGLAASDTWQRVVFDLRNAESGFQSPTGSFRLDFVKTPIQTYWLRDLQLSTFKREWGEESSARDMLVVKANKIPLGVSPSKLRTFNFQKQTVAHSTKGAKTLAFTFDRELDLDAQTKDHSEFANRVDFAPALVVGQGEHPSNKTVVRILNQYGTCETQFLAFPEEVQGGVDVSTGRNQAGEVIIAAAPLLDKKNDQIKLFSRFGALLHTIAVDRAVTPPFSIAVGNCWRSSRGDELAVCSRKRQSRKQVVLIYSLKGELLNEYTVKNSKYGAADINLSILDNKIHYYSSRSQECVRLDGKDKETRIPLSCSSKAEQKRLFPSAFSDFVVVRDDPIASKMVAFSEGHGRPLDVGRRENTFWIAPQQSFGEQNAGLHWDNKIEGKDFKTGDYIRRGHFVYMRAHNSINAKEMKGFANAYGSYKKYLQSSQKFMNKYLSNFDSSPPALWEATTSQRKNHKFWYDEFLPRSKVPRYCVLNRLNGPAKDLTYNYDDLPLLKKVMTYGLRASLRAIVAQHRMNPEHFIAVEPVHEFEIVSDGEGLRSIGDYNPESIKNFYHFLINHYGSLEAINDSFKTPFTAKFFDAPRDLYRGEWDRYDNEKNPFFEQWFRFNMRTVYRKIFECYREALLAGFAPETIKSHQIPDAYVGTSLNGFTRPSRRVSPVDLLLHSGTGFGFTRYKTWYQNPQTMINSAYSSGFSMTSLGEYAPRNTSPSDSYQQLLKLWNSGAYFIHHMAWSPKDYPGQNQAALKGWNMFSASNDKPRPHVAGGITKVVPHARGKRNMDLVGIGSVEGTTGLIKSIVADGSWEGSVYTVPFHSAVNVVKLQDKKMGTIKSGGLIRCFDPIDKIRGGSVLDISFKCKGPSNLMLRLQANGFFLENQTASLDLDRSETNYRINYRFPHQVEDVALFFKSSRKVTLYDIQIHLHEDQSARLRDSSFEGVRHKCGVYFDVLPES